MSIDVIKDSFLSPAAKFPERGEVSAQKITALSRTILTDLVSGLKNSRIFKAAIVTVLSTAAFAFLLQPSAWILVAMSVASFAFSLWLTEPAVLPRVLQEVSFELSALYRLTKSEKYQQIEGTSLFLGSLPNRLSSDMAKIESSGIGSVLSINESWERSPMGFSLPYKREDWESKGIAYYTIDQEDHVPLDIEQLNKAADWLDSQVQQGKKVLVHCRAGKGRSAMAVASYLMRYQGMSVAEACHTVKESRSGSTIHKQKYGDGLTQFNRKIKGDL